MDYQGNSKKDKDDKVIPPKKNLEKIITGDATVKQKTLVSRAKNIVFGGDAKTAATYVVSEVLLPAVRNLVVEMVSKGTDRLMYGEHASRRRTASYGSRVSYNNPINRSTQGRGYLPDQRPIDRWTQGRKAFDDVILASKSDAEAVVEGLINIVDKYEIASVADLYELLGLPSSHVDNKWGWTHLSGVDVQQVREGYQISFPPLEEIS